MSDDKEVYFGVCHLPPQSPSTRTQATIAMSRAVSELYGIWTSVNESLLRKFLIESDVVTKVQIRVYTDSTAGAGRSKAARQGASKKAKHMDIRFLYTQAHVRDGCISMHKVHRLQNAADGLTKHISRETLHRLLHAVGLHP